MAATHLALVCDFFSPRRGVEVATLPYPWPPSEACQKVYKELEQTEINWNGEAIEEEVLARINGKATSSLHARARRSVCYVGRCGRQGPIRTRTYGQ